MQEALEAVVLMLSPIVPHITHTLWQALGHTEAVIDCRWPTVDEAAREQTTVTLVVQVNGKRRGQIEVPVNAAKETIEETALANGNVQKFTSSMTIRRVIVVPGRLVNVVAR
jgi:leucyl-tRNA synthetase